MKLESTLLKTISQKQDYSKSFFDLVNDFESKLIAFDPINNKIQIRDYFENGKGNGIASIRKSLVENKILTEKNIYSYTTRGGKKKTDVKGLYIFYHENIPIYVGISKGIISRTLQHLRGKSHNTSTLAYNIGLIRYEIEKGNKYIGNRNEFDFNSNVSPAKDFLFNQSIAYLPIENDEELYLFEIFCAMKLGCWLNKFETH